MFLAGAVLGAGAGWWMGLNAQLMPPPPPPPPIETAAVTAPVPPPAAPEPVPLAPPKLPVEAAVAALAPEVQTAQPAVPETMEPPAPVVPEPAGTAAKACATEATPADRTICADEGLQALQAELRQAYAAALEAHEDRTLLWQRQLAWRSARNAVTHPDRLARLYEERIRRLNSAAAAARAAR